ncbi:MAG TPA: Spy/CpxP family protein refolding chaperone [Pseudomonadales bacterium]|nr:Spy/CpxP family protein refolding chaperone [Pseudomonadales bacterium]
MTNKYWLKIMAMGLVVSAAGYTLNTVAMHPSEENLHNSDEQMIALLDLNEEQKLLFDAMHHGHRGIQDKMARVDTRKALHELARQENFDVNKAQRIAEAVGREASIKAYYRAEALHRFYRSLSEEQRAKFDVQHESRLARRQDTLSLHGKHIKRADRHVQSPGDHHHAQHGSHD